jgi:cytochrome c-type biogenesis protein CcmF
MEKIQYVGEALWIGHLCKAMIFGAFISACLAAVAYFFSTQNRENPEGESWKKIGRVAYWIHGGSILTLLATMFYAMKTHHYEYNYVFEHVSKELPLKYILSAFWEGQEGSFLLWMFWHIVIGFYFIKKNDQWHAPVMAVMALAEVWLTSMILGIHLDIFGSLYKIGSNPMLLIRDAMAAPIFNNANYLSLIKGRGLNPLLQNYWMTIHPPTVFAAFALSIVPFAYAVAALWTKTYTTWIRVVLPYALMAATVLGISLIMGSLWAYEALSFGGYWAWDPVENTSLVPWIILVGGIHTNLIAKATNHGVRSTFLFYILGFLLIVYSTLLTRSGILGDTSAHAFTEMGLEWQLTYFLLTFLFIGFTLLIYHYKKVPAPEKEESIYSREFWMYVGALVLLFSGILINASSSLPVFNRIARVFDPAYIGRVIKDPIQHYNKYQLWIAVFIGVLTGIAVWFQWRSTKTDFKKLITYLAIHIGIAILFTGLTTLWIELPSWQNVVMAFSSLFAISTNIHYLVSKIKTDTKGISAAISHLGFGIMAVGMLATGLNFKYLSNPFMFKGLFQEEGGEDKYMQLIKHRPVMANNEYLVTYDKDTLIGNARLYDIKFVQMDKNLNRIDSFITRPNAVYSNDFSKIAAFNPDNRHYAHKDIFTCVVSLPPSVADSEQARALEDSVKYVAFDANMGDTITLKNKIKVVLTKLNFKPQHPEYIKHRHDVGAELGYKIIDGKQSYDGITAIGLDENILYKYPGNVESLGMRIRPAEKLIDNLLTPEEQLQYQTFSLKKDEVKNIYGHEIKLIGFDQQMDSIRYKKQEGDVAITGIVQCTTGSVTHEARPIFVIRGNAPMSIKDYVPELGLHIRLSSIDPTTNTFELKVAKDKRTNALLSVEIANDVPRNDYLILEAKIFPGINLFWLGAILMMVGLLIAWYRKDKENKLHL